MTYPALRLIPLLVALGSVAACAPDATGPLPEKPATVAPSPTPAPAPTLPAFPPLPRAGIIYDRVTASSVGNQRYVIYDDGTFALQYVTHHSSFLEYKGKVSRAGSVLTFLFDANGGEWIPEGVVQGDLPTVEYNSYMVLSDFENGVYRTPALAWKANIYLAPGDGSNAVRLAEGDWPTWSPDGLRLAFHRHGYVHIIDADGSDEIRLVRGAYAAWSPDGARLAFTNSDGIAVMNADGSAITTLIRHKFRDDTYAPWDMGVGKPAWSPDGKSIAFEHMGDGDMTPAQIYVVNADGTNTQRPTFNGQVRYAESDPSWAPDGSQIVFWSYGYGIAAVSRNGGGPSSIYKSFPTVAYGSRPTLSFDGTQIAFTAGRFPSNKPEIWTKRLHGGEPKLLIRNAYDAAWSPRSERIAFVSAGLQ